METVFVAMSGGMDSSFAAYMLKQQGYDVVGITYQLLPEFIKNVSNPKACCSIETVARARKVADDLSIPHYVMNLREDFERYVIDRFIEEYKAGRTPNPCVLCNKYIKFSSFFRKALSMGAAKVATGHYAVIGKTPAEGWSLRKSRDRAKDQSYFLYPMKKEILGDVLFPLGGETKKELKAQAHLIRWDTGKIRESQDICFVPEGDYRQFLSRFIPLKKGPAYFVDGTLLGHHEGIHMYTMGQRRGLGIPFREPLYVVEIRSSENALILGTKDHMKKSRLIADEVNLLGPPSGSASGKVRYRQGDAACTYRVSGDTLEVEFAEPLNAITPGQSVVVYQEDRVVAGGVIKSSA
jgi:tRNA-uridine 2-sulfurtransferase